MTKPSTGRKRVKKVTVKAWAVILTLKPDFRSERFYWTKKDAESSYRKDLLKYHKVVPVTITYEV